MTNSIKLLYVIGFIVSIWIVNLFLLPIVSSGLDNLRSSQKELLIKQSFSNNTPSNLSKSINEFIPSQFDKIKITDLIAKLAQESNVSIVSLDIKPSTNRDVISREENTVDTVKTQTESKSVTNNNLKVIDLDIDITGNKNSIDAFLSKLAKSKQYIEIIGFNIDLQFESDLDSSQGLSASIVAKTYYIKL